MSSAFQSNGFQNNAFQIARAALLTGTGGIDKGKKRLSVKPTGLSPKKRAKITKNDEIVQVVEQIALEVAEKIALPEVQEFEKITLSEIDVEIGTLLKKKQKTEEEQRRIAMMLIILAANA